MSSSADGSRGPEAFASVLRRQRVAAGLTQSELATRASLSERTVSNLERGINTTPYPNTVRLLAEALGLPEADRAELMGAARPGGGSAPVRPPPVGGFLGATPPSRLVSREAEWATLAEALTATAGGEGRLVLLTGEPGIGKTRLVQEVSSEASERGFAVASGRCYESRSGAPFVPFLEVLASMHALAPEAVRDNIVSRWPMVATLLPDEFPNASLPSRSTPDNAERLYRAVAGFARDLAAVRPLAILLDDLHWADGASLELLAHLARHTRGDRVLIVGTHRPADVGPDRTVWDLARSLRRERIAETVQVDRLDREATALLIVDRLDDEFVSQEFSALIHSHTGGNPFFTVETLTALIERGDLSRIHGRWVRRELIALAAPVTVSEAIGERVSRLSPTTQRALETVSVLGEVFDLEDLENLDAGDDAPALDAALDEAVAAGLLTESAGRYTFDHGLTQRALYSSIAPARRRRLHRRTGEQLQRLPDGSRRRRAAEIARHLDAGGMPGRAVPYLLLAGEVADGLHSPGEAVRHYRHGLALADQLGDEAAAAQAHERLGGVLLRTAHHDESMEHLVRASEGFSRVGDLPSRLRAEGTIAEALYRLGASETAAVRLDGLLDELEGSMGPEEHPAGLAALWSGLATARMGMGEHARCVEAAEQAARLARAEGDQVIEATAEAIGGVALQFLDRHDDAVHGFERSLDLAVRVEADAVQSYAILALEWTCAIRGDLDRARELGERGLEITRRTGDTDAETHHAADVGLVLFYLGDWTAAQEYLERSVRHARAGDPSLFGGVAPAYLGLLRRGQGDLTAAAALYDEAALSPDVDTFALNGYLDARRAELDLVQGRPAEALSRLAPWLDQESPTKIHDVVLFSTAAEACVDLGDAARAEDLVTRALRRADVTSNVVDGIDATRLRGRVLALLGRYADARTVLEDVLSQAEALPHPAAQARAHRDLARVARAEGDAAEARRRFEAALAILDRLGAAHDAALVSDELRAVGG